MNTKLLVGLGNPGKEYEKTRHNAGFIAADLAFEYFKNNGATVLSDWKNGKNHKYLEASLQYSNFRLYFIKPQTYMNLSGGAVTLAKSEFYIKDNADILILCDELDLQVGTIKITPLKYSKTHNGVSSIRETAGKGFWFFRIGIESRQNRMIAGEDFVLMKFSDDDYAKLRQGIIKGLSQLDTNFLV